MTDITEAAAAQLIRFYDSAGGTYPAGAHYIAAYADGEYQADPDVYDDYAHVHSITTLGLDWRPQLGDYEPGLPLFDVPGRCLQWVERRVSRKLRAIPYCDRFDLHLLLAELGPVLFGHPLVQFWIPTLDGIEWTPQGLSASIMAETSIWVAPGRIWANQNKDARQSGGDWDTSNLFGTW